MVAAAGVGTSLIGLVVLAFDVPRWNTLWFLFGWVGWLLVVDAAIAGSGGVSFLGGRRRELGAMLLWSVPYWTLFEGYNFVLKNWSYVFLPRSELAQALFAGAAFATVLPACFFHADWLRTRGVFEAVRWRPLTVGPGVEAGLVIFGLACAGLPLVAPTVAYPLVWGATFGIPEVINRRIGAPSLLADLEAGRPARLLRLLVGGAVAGGVWEGLNSFARAKWVYTVPGFEEWKLFEMPLLGFLGFPVLAVQAFSAYALLSAVARGGRHWERPDAAQPRVPSAHTWRAIALLVGFSVLADRFPLDPAVLARRPILDELPDLRPGDRDALAAVGLSTPERLAGAVAREGAHAVAARTGVPVDRVDRAADHAAMALHKGMGAPFAALLLDLGVREPEDLAAADAHVLVGELAVAAQQRGMRAPERAQVQVWIRAARLHRGWRR